MCGEVLRSGEEVGLRWQSMISRPAIRMFDLDCDGDHREGVISNNWVEENVSGGQKVEWEERGQEGNGRGEIISRIERIGNLGGLEIT